MGNMLFEDIGRFDGAECWYQRNMNDADIDAMVTIFRKHTNIGTRPKFKTMGEQLKTNPNHISEAWQYWCYLVNIFERSKK